MTTIFISGNDHGMEEFWAEAANNKEQAEDEDLRVNASDEESEAEEADWLSEIGLQELTQQWRQGESLSNDIGQAVQKLSLKPHQADAVRRRIRTLNATLKRKKNHKIKPDVRSFFQSEISENKDSSRSATPDSLDSNEFLEDSPPRRFSPPNYNSSSPSNELEDTLHPLPNNQIQVPRFISLFEQQHHQQHSSSSSPSRQDLFKTQSLFPVRNTNTTEGEIASDDITGIEMLNYHNVGTIYMKGYIPAPLSLPCPIPTNKTKVTINTITTGAFIPTSRDGFTEELMKRTYSSSSEEEDMDEEPHIEPSGLILLSDLSEDDAKKIRPLLLMELTAQCDHKNIQVRRKKVQKGANKKIPIEESAKNLLFGMPLDALLAKDRQKMNELEVPILFEKMITFLRKRSLDEEGLLRIAGNRTKINELRTCFESSLYTEPEQVDLAMNQCSSHDVSTLLKQFLRELPIPLLGFDYIDTFFSTASILHGKSQINCLRLLVLLLPQSHQAVLRTLLIFLKDLIKNSEVNKMNLQNVATIMAPNLVPTCALGSRNKELSRAATWVKCTQILIKHANTLFYIPSDLVYQLRQINDLTRNKKAKGKQNAANGKNNPAPLSNASTNGGNAQRAKTCSNSLVVSAPQLGFPEVILPVNAGTSAGDIVFLLLEEADKKAEDLEASQANNKNGVRRRGGPRSQDLLKNGPNLSCLLTKMSRSMALQTHSLYEIGGNIGYRKVDPLALLPAICRDNPGANWVLRCNHRHSTNI